jgi:hypothetical protein
VYDPSSPAGDQYADPFERGRSAGGGGGGDRTAPGSAPGMPATAPGTAGPPTRQADAVAAFGAGVKPRFAEGSSTGGAPRRSHTGADRAAADRALAASEIKGVDSSATGDLLLLAAISAGLVLTAALLGRLRRRNTR